MMKSFLKIIPLVICLFSFLSCKHDDLSSTHLKVYKSDSSLQCQNVGIALDVMALELVNAGIDVICSQKGHDGLLRPALCGYGTGNINIYTINRANLSDAEFIGFEDVTTLSEYQDQDCQ